MKNNMNNDDETYLWDKAGDPDPEIQELERVLSTLRYQPRELVIPESLKVETQRSSFLNFGPRLAIAATVILAVGAAAIWLSVGRKDTRDQTADTKPSVSKSERAAVTVPEDVPSDLPGNESGSVPAGTSTESNQSGDAAPSANNTNPGRRNRYHRPRVVENTNRGRVAEPAMPVLAENELREAEAGKAKLMLALRVASTKLNVALRKAQGTNTGNLIHNQHKIG